MNSYFPVREVRSGSSSVKIHFPIHTSTRNRRNIDRRGSVEGPPGSAAGKRPRLLRFCALREVLQARSTSRSPVGCSGKSIRLTLGNAIYCSERGRSGKCLPKRYLLRGQTDRSHSETVLCHPPITSPRAGKKYYSYLIVIFLPRITLLYSSQNLS